MFTLRVSYQTIYDLNMRFVIQVMDHVYLQEGENVNHLYINYYELELQVNFYILIKLTLGLNIFKSVLMQAVVVMRAFLLWHLDLWVLLVQV